MTSRNIDDLHPHVAKLCRAFIEKCKAAGIDVLITCTYRSKEDQDALYAQGRTKPGQKITNAKGGQSIHNYRLAFDFAPLKNGKIDWNDTALFRRCGEIGQGVGLEWGGAWHRFPDMPHLQWTGGLSLADLQAGKKPPEVA